ncbi:hypothetical protein ACFQZF_09150 [Flavobacterium myungsuense]|uniref:glycoside hydrolase family 130 protein n=1 Tax=Flavobacterium myungsuense TaxID=651823 RepID=UPI00362F1FD9
MLQIKKEGIILEKRALGFEKEGVLNPAVIADGEDIHIFYRAVGKDNYSTIGYCKLNLLQEVKTRLDVPLLFPQFDYEKQGVEDPRIVKIEDLYYLTYTANDGLNAMGALATSKDLVTWEKRGLIVPEYSYEEFQHLAETRGELNEKYFRFNAKYILPKNLEKKHYYGTKISFFFQEK